MIHLTGELFHLSDGRLMLAHNEQDTFTSIGDIIVFDKRVYTIIGIVPPSNPNGKWAIQIEECGNPNEKLFKCIALPKVGVFTKGEVYEWTWCMDGIIVFDDNGAQVVFGENEAFQYFSVLSGW